MLFGGLGKTTSGFRVIAGGGGELGKGCTYTCKRNDISKMFPLSNYVGCAFVVYRSRGYMVKEIPMFRMNENYVQCILFKKLDMIH